MSQMLSDYIIAHRKPNEIPVKAIKCKDGLTLSVQAHYGAYCTPRDNDGPWVKFEIGFPSQKIEEIMEWCEDPKLPTGTVYGYVPGEVIEQVIAKHGGMA